MNEDIVMSTGLSTGTKITQKPELYVSVDLEKMSKGGFKRTLKTSVRVFDGDTAHAEALVLELLASAGRAADAQAAIEEGKDDGREG